MKQRSIFTLIFLSFVLFSQGQSFGEIHTITTGIAKGVSDVHSCDIDNDGDFDILAATDYYDKILLLENNGDGSFQKIRSLVQEIDNVFKMITMDVDNDGLLDVVYIYGYKHHWVGWARNLGNNEFKAMGGLYNARTDYISWLMSYDVNSNGLKDIIIDGDTDFRFPVFINNGDGTFEYPVSLIDSPFTGQDQFFDFDNDQDLDLLSIEFTVKKTSIYLNDGNWNYNEEIIVEEESLNQIQGSHMFDSDGDGDMDIISGYYSSPDTRPICLFINNGNGIFTDTVELFYDHNFEIIKSLDYDSDGDLDIFYSNGYNLGFIKNNGNNIFERMETKNKWLWVEDFLFEDVNNDGKIDIVFGSKWDRMIGWYENTESNPFQTVHSLTSVLSGIPSIDTKDVNGDSFVDICVPDNESRYTFFLNDGKGNFDDTITTHRLHRYSDGVMFDDFNRDGYCDFLSHSDYSDSNTDDSSNFFIARNTGNNSFVHIGISDFDHITGIIFFKNYDTDEVNEVICCASQHTIYIFKVSEGFTVNIIDTININYSDRILNVEFADFDNNGEKDMIGHFENWDDYYDYFLICYSHDGTFNTTFDTILQIQGYYFMDVINFNNDGYPDIVVNKRGHQYLFENNREGGFTKSEYYLDYHLSFLSGDVNNDSIDDYFYGTTNSDEAVLIENKGNGVFEEEIFPFVEMGISNSSYYENTRHLVDLDYDGDLDFLISNYYGSDISWLENNLIHASVKENETNNSLLVYPNPAGESINIKLEEAAATDYEILLYNNLGMEINRFQAEANQTQMSINTKNLKAGVYYVVLKSGNNISTSKVLIVR